MAILGTIRGVSGSSLNQARSNAQYVALRALVVAMMGKLGIIWVTPISLIVAAKALAAVCTCISPRVQVV